MKKRYMLLGLLLLLFSGCSGEPREIIIDGSFEVEKQDQTTQELLLIVSEPIANITLVENLSLGQKHILINSNVTPLVSNLLCIKDSDGNLFTQDEIQSVTSLGGNLYNVTIESGVEFAYSVGDGCSIRNTNLAVDGSITPREFSVSPIGLHSSVEWDLTRIICTSSGDGVTPSDLKPDLTDFFTTEATNKGMLFRLENKIYYKNLYYAKDNKDFVSTAFDYDISEANRQGEYSFTFRKTNNGDDKSGVTHRLSANETNYNYHRLKIIVERDLTDVSEIICKVSGHETDNFLVTMANEFGSFQAYYESLI